MYPHHMLLDHKAPPPIPVYDNPNQHLSTQGMLITLGINIAVFVCLVAIFEVHRFYKQIYLKRLQKRFEDIGRVPPIPRDFAFGWLHAIFQVTEMDVLRMVGLDAYMLLRYHVVCYKLALFLSFWGILVLLPIYVTANSHTLKWDKYTLSNVVSGSLETKYRLWAAAIFGYVFAAYFMQLLYAEYNNFSVRRLQYLVQANPDSPQGDPDTPPQKYFTIMVERIPGHLRSAAALYKFFEKLFPGEVYNVEIALDLKKLNSMTRQRQSVRDSLEKAIAYYEATNIRPEVFIQTGKITIFPDESTGIASEGNTWTSFLQRAVAPEIYGFEKLDSLSYYTNRLVELNAKVDEMQHVSFEYARKADKDLQRKLKNRHDTRAAEMVEKVKSRSGMFGMGGTASGSDKRQNPRRGNRKGGKPRDRERAGEREGASVSGAMQSSGGEDDERRSESGVKKSSSQGSGLGGGEGSKSSGNFFEKMLFGAPVQEYQTIAAMEMNKVKVKNYDYGPGLTSYSNDNVSRNEEVQDPQTEKRYPFKMGGHTPGPVDISTSRTGRDGGGGAVNPMHVRDVDDRRSSPNITVVSRSQGGFKIRHESIGSQDSDNTSASSEFEHEHGHDDEMDTSLSPAAPPQSRYIRSLSEAMRPENFDLLSGEYATSRNTKTKEKEKGAGKGSKGSDGRTTEDDSIKPWSASEAMKKAAFGSTVTPAHPGSSSASASIATSITPSSSTAPHIIPSSFSSSSSSFQPTLMSIAEAAPSQPSSHLTPPTSISPIPVPTPISVPPPSGRPPTGLSNHPTAPNLAVVPPHNPSSGIPGIAEGVRHSSHVPFDGSLRPPDTDRDTDVDMSVTESEDESSPVSRYVRHGRQSGKGEDGDVSDVESIGGRERDRDRESERSSDKEGAISMEGDATLREWMKTAQVNLKEELRLAEQRAEQFAADSDKQRRLSALGTKVVDINDLLDPSATSISGITLPMIPVLSMPSIVTRNIVPPPGDFSVDLDAMNMSSHTPFSTASPRGTQKSQSTAAPSLAPQRAPSVTSSTTGVPLTTHSSSSGATHSAIPSSTPFSTSSTSMNISNHSVRSTSSIPMVGFKRDLSDVRTSEMQNSSKSDNMYANELNARDANATNNPMYHTEGREGGWNEGEEEDYDPYGYANAATGSRLERMSSSMQSSVNQTMSNISSQMMSQEQLEEANKLAKVGVEKAKLAGKQGWEETKKAGSGALRGIIEVERAFEMLTLGAFYKYSSTAFVTFNSRITESIAQQMLLSHDAMEINHAPNPNDIIWENVSIPKSQVRMRNYITNIGLVVGSLFWSTLVTSVNQFSSHANLPQYQQQYLSVIIVLVFLLVLPFIFDFLARNYEGMKLESEIQNSIMTRYFYYQLINVYVTVGFGGSNIITQILLILRQPQTLVDILGRTIPSVSLYFVNLVIVKIFTAVPLEMMRPWQLSTILMMGTFMDRRKCTRRELRTGAFYAWPMLYGWVYPQLMMVTMIMVTYSCIAPLLMPFCVLFFVFAYLLYKYQLLYVYINDYQSGGEMWYAVFSRSLIALLFAAFTLLGYLSLELNQTYLAGPFYFLLPLPFSIVYFWHYCEAKFKLPSMNLSFGFAKELDHRNNERRVSGKPVPHDSFRKDLYRQPALTERGVYPEPYRRDNTYDHLRGDDDEEDMEEGKLSSLTPKQRNRMERRGSLSLNVHEELDQGEDNQRVMEAHFNEVVLPLAAEYDQKLSQLRQMQHQNSQNRAERGRGRGRGGGGRGGQGRGGSDGVVGDVDDVVESPIHTRPRS